MKNLFNVGDIVRVVNGTEIDSSNKLNGMLFELIHGGEDSVTLDLTPVAKATGLGWAFEEGKYGWYIQTNEIELVAPVNGYRKAPRTTTPRTKAGLTPQCRQLLELLEAKGSVTALEASGVYRIRALPRRIADLKEAGYKIVRDLGKDVTGQRYARYYLKGQAVAA